MSTFDCDGSTLWFEAIGGGELMIALHGGLGLDHTYFRPWLDPLGTDHHLVFTDLRANGRSSGDGSDLTMARLAQDVDALREHLGHERTWLLGHSYGGFVALEYALRFPEQLRGLILLDTDSSGPSPETMMAGLQRLGVAPEEMSAFETPVTSTEDLLDLFDTVEPWYLPHSEPGTARAVLGRTIYRAGGSEGGNRALYGWDVGGRLSHIVTPTLVVTGVDDFMFPPQRAELMSTALPHATVEVVHGSGHLPFVEQTDVVLASVRGFVDRVESELSQG